MNQGAYDFQVFNVCVITQTNGTLSDECHIVAAIEKEDVMMAVRWYYRESEILAIIFN